MKSELVGVALPCPRCLAMESSISWHFGTPELRCEDCGESFKLEELEQILEIWNALVGKIRELQTIAVHISSPVLDRQTGVSNGQ